MPSEAQETDPFTVFETAQELSELVSVNADKVAGWKERGIDPRPHHAIIYRHANGTVQRQDGHWAVAEVSHDMIRNRFGAGNYTVKVFNASNQILAQNGASIPGAASSAPASNGDGGLGALLGGGLPQGGSSSDRLLVFLLSKVLERQEPKQDPLREIVGSMAALIQAQVSMLNAQPKAQAPDDTAAKLLLAIVPKLLEQKQNPAPVPGQNRSIEEFLSVLRFGMGIAGAHAKSGSSNGKKNPSDDEWGTKFLEILPELAESVGPPLITTIALAMLPKDKADAVIAMMADHMRTREAREAEAVHTEPINTEGIPMP